MKNLNSLIPPLEHLSEWEIRLTRFAGEDVLVVTAKTDTYRSRAEAAQAAEALENSIHAQGWSTRLGQSIEIRGEVNSSDESLAWYSRLNIRLDPTGGQSRADPT
jgi:hypothetical protein